MIKLNYFRCNNFLCIPNSKVCNGISECGDNSDEEGDNCETKNSEWIIILLFIRLKSINIINILLNVCKIFKNCFKFELDNYKEPEFFEKNCVDYILKSIKLRKKTNYFLFLGWYFGIHNLVAICHLFTFSNFTK